MHTHAAPQLAHDLKGAQCILVQVPVATPMISLAGPIIHQTTIQPSAIPEQTPHIPELPPTNPSTPNLTVADRPHAIVTPATRLTQKASIHGGEG